MVFEMPFKEVYGMRRGKYLEFNFIPMDVHGIVAINQFEEGHCSIVQNT